MRTPRATKVKLPPVVGPMPKGMHTASEHNASAFQAVHPDNTAKNNFTDMYEVKRREEFLKKIPPTGI